MSNFRTMSNQHVLQAVTVRIGHIVLFTSCSLHAPIKRGQAVWPYTVTGDERLLEFDFDEIVFEEESPFQLVQILHSPTLGNVLLLDGDLSTYLRH